MGSPVQPTTFVLRTASDLIAARYHLFSIVNSVALAALVGILAASSVHAQRSTTGRAVRAERAPVIDGRDDDAVWAKAVPLTDFRQFDPGEDVPTSFRTEARVAYDDRNFYVLVRAFDPAPDSIVSRNT